VCVFVCVFVVCPTTFHTISKGGRASALKCINNGVKCLSARKYQSHGLAPQKSYLFPLPTPLFLTFLKQIEEGRSKL